MMPVTMLAGQYDEDGAQHAGERIDRVVEVQLGNVAQHQQTDIHQGRCGGVSGYQIAQRGEEDHQQEQHADQRSGQTGLATGSGACGRLDVDGSRSTTDGACHHAADGVGSQGLAAADDVATFVDEACLTGHGTDGAGGVKTRRSSPAPARSE